MLQLILRIKELWQNRRSDLLKSEGFVIYAGQGNLQSVLFRIANMGDISDSDWQRLIDIFRNKVCS